MYDENTHQKKRKEKKRKGSMFGVVRLNAVRARAATNALAAAYSATNLRNFSKKSECPDLNLVQALDYEIKLTQSLAVRPAAPADFPFEFRDLSSNYHQQRMSRMFADEETSEKEEINVDFRIDEGDVLDLNVGISKASLGGWSIVASASAHEISIIRMSLVIQHKSIVSNLYIKPDCEMQFALREFLALRGIKSSYYGYLRDHMLWNSTLPDPPNSHYDDLPRNFNQQNVDSLTKLKEVMQSWS